MRPLPLLCVIGAVALSAGCSSGVAPCGPANCAGCCQGEKCYPGAANDAGQCVTNPSCQNVGQGCGAASCCQGLVCQNGTCAQPSQCSGGLTACGTSCVNTASDPANCGACNHACGTNQICQASQCQASIDCRQGPCPSGYYCDLSNGQCQFGCAADSQCPQPGTCDLGTHRCVCGAGTHACSGQCLSDTSPQSCGTSCTPCTAPSGGTAICINGACGVTCQGSGIVYCGGSCIAESTQACGSSCAVCTTPANGSVACVAGQCQTTCLSGYHACAGQCASDSDATACGASCQVCPGAVNGTAVCTAGRCGLACSSGYIACGGRCLDASTLFTIGGTPDAGAVTNAGLVVADFNFDQWPDLVLTDGASSSNLLVVYNQGNGVFSQSAVTETANIGPYVTDLEQVSADSTDLVAAETDWQIGIPGPGYLAAMYGGGAPFTTQGGNEEYDLVVGDFNGDGRPDVVATDPSANVVRTFLGNGTTTFATPTNSSGVCTYPAHPIAGDFNGDGKLDVVVTCWQQTGAELLLGKGDGTFLPPTALPGVTSNTSDGAAADLNGDGRVDLVLVSPAQLFVLLNAGGGNFASATVLQPSSSQSGTLAAQIGDMNGDGIPDVVWTQDYPSGVAVLLGNGDGTFQPPVVSTMTVGGLFRLADLNQDGTLDLAILDSAKVEVLLNQCH